MEFCAIISEFNPFHNGHDYLIKEAKKQTGLPIMCIMSGNFVQRGEPAIVDKYTRALCAIEAGADMVVELPTVYSLSSAENFAKGAIKALKDLGCKTIAVGATYDNLRDYENLARIKNSNIAAAMQDELEKGQNYNTALINVLASKYPTCRNIFTDGSNILALEYVHQIFLQKANINVLLVKRTDGGYNSETAKKQYANATIIRTLAKTGQKEKCKKYMPEFAYEHFNVLSANALDNILLYELRKKTPEELTTYLDYTEGLPYLVSAAVQNNNDLQTAISEACSKRYRLPRIKKLFLYPALGITKANFDKIVAGKSVCKLIAIRKTAKAFLNEFNKHGIKIIVSKHDTEELSPAQKLSAKIDLDASNLYAIATNGKFNGDLKTGTLFL